MTLSEELTLDISGALASIDEVGSALSTIASQMQSQLEEALAPLQDVTVEQADASAVEASVAEAIEAGAAAPVVVEGDASELGGSIDEALASLPEPVITVSADTTEAQESIEALGDTAAAATVDVGGLDTATASLGAASGLASGSAAGLGSVISKTGAGAAAAVGGVALLTGEIGSLFTTGVNVEAGLLRFNNTLGAFAEEVSQINVAGLDISLSDLNAQLGSSTTETRNAVATFFQMGDAAGISGDRVALASEQVVALAAAARASNPALGSVGQNVDALSLKLARGGRFVAKYGIDLQAQEIEERAQELFGLKDSYSVVEKAVAGADVATEKYGATLEKRIAEGTENPIIKLEALGRQLASTKAELAAPLVAPIFEILESLTPVAQAFAGVIGKLSAAVLPGVSAALDGIAPVLVTLGDTLGGVFQELEPAFTAIGESVGEVFKELAPVIKLVAGSFAEILSVSEPFLKIAGELLGVVAGLLGKFLELPGVLEAIELALAVVTAPFTLLANTLETAADLLGIGGEGFGTFGTAAVAAAEQIAGVSGGMDTATGSVEDFDTATSDLSRRLNTEVTDAVAGLKTEVIELNDELFAAPSAVLDYQESLLRVADATDAVAEAERKNHEVQTSATATAAERAAASRDIAQANIDLTRAQQGVAESALDMEAAQAEVETALRTGNQVAVQQLREEYIRLRDQFPETAAAVDPLIAQLDAAAIERFAKISLEQDTLANSISGAFRAGVAITEGLAAGIESATQAVAFAAAAVAQAAIDAAALALEFGSPSKVFAELGESIPQGLAVGMDRDAQLAVAAAEQIVRDAASVAATPAVAGIASSSVAVGGVVVHVNVTGALTDEQALATGRQVGAGIEARLAELNLRAAAAIGGPG